MAVSSSQDWELFSIQQEREWERPLTADPPDTLDPFYGHIEILGAYCRIDCTSFSSAIVGSLISLYLSLSSLSLSLALYLYLFHILSLSLSSLSLSLSHLSLYLSLSISLSLSLYLSLPLTLSLSLSLSVILLLVSFKRSLSARPMCFFLREFC